VICDPRTVIKRVAARIRGLQDARFRTEGDEGYFVATLGGRMFSIVVYGIGWKNTNLVVEYVVETIRSEIRGAAS
jgi:hypothetical protein